jgi:hypothetical protein
MTGGVTLGVPGPVADGNTAMGFDGTGYLHVVPAHPAADVFDRSVGQDDVPCAHREDDLDEHRSGEYPRRVGGYLVWGTVAGQTVAAFYSHVGAGAAKRISATATGTTSCGRTTAARFRFTWTASSIPPVAGGASGNRE